MKDYILETETQRQQVRLSAYGSTSARSYPVSLVFSGVYWGSGYVANQNEGGYLYSNLGMVTKNSHSISLDITTGTVNPVGQSQKLHYFALRCPYGSTSARSYPMSLVYSGIYSWIGGGYLDYQNEWAFIYTSSTLIYNNKELGQDLLISKNVVNPGAGNDKRVGHSLRWL